MTEREFKRAQRIAMYGSNIPKSGQRAAYAQAEATAAKRGAAIDAGFTPPTAAATGDLLKRRLELFKSMQDMGREEAAGLAEEAAGLQISRSGFRQALNQIPVAGTTPAVTPPVTTPAANTPAGTTIPPFIRRPLPPTPTPPEGRINGMPASQAIAAVGAPAAVGEPAQFGKEFAEGNIEKLGLTGAIADYRRRVAEEGKPAEPGNMEQLRLRDTVGPPKPTKSLVGPLQSYLNQAISERESQKITAGLNASSLPNITGRGVEPSSERGPVATGRSLVRVQTAPNDDTAMPSKYTVEERRKAREDAAEAIRKARTGNPPTIGYRLGRGVFDTLGNSAMESYGRGVKQAAGDAAIATELAVGGAAIQTGKKIKRNARGFFAGLSGR